jgi:hypothetical protein
METAMRTLTFILAFGFAFAAPSFNATAESNLPGAGAFTYSDAQPGNTMAIAHLTLTTRGKKLPIGTQGNAHEAASDVARG